MLTGARPEVGRRHGIETRVDSPGPMKCDPGARIGNMELVGGSDVVTTADSRPHESRDPTGVDGRRRHPDILSGRVPLSVAVPWLRMAVQPIVTV